MITLKTFLRHWFRVPPLKSVLFLLGLAVLGGFASLFFLFMAVLAVPLNLGLAEDFILYRWFSISRGDAARSAASALAVSTALTGLLLFKWRRLGELKNPAVNMALLISTVVITLFATEIGYRLINDIPLLPIENHIAKDRALLKTQQANDYDTNLGWVLKPNMSISQHNAENSFTTGEYGIRMNSNEARPIPTGAILAVGDSFTVGSEVGDRHSWPAQVERLLGKPVVNGSTGGWGSDQIVLRAEQLAPVLKPRTIILSFLAADILRAGLRVYGSANKPWFDLDRNGNLIRHNKPVPVFSGKPSEVGFSLFGYFHVLTFALDRVGLGTWLRSGVEEVENGNDSVAVTCRLLERAHKTFSSQNIRLVFMLQHAGDDRHDRTSQKPHADAVIACARKAGIETIDTWRPLLLEYRKGFQSYKELFVMHDNNRLYGHMTSKGNALIANLVAKTLRN